MKKMRRTRKGGFPVMVLFLTFITVFCSAGTAMSRSDLSTQELEGYYREQERILVDEARSFLDAKGFVNSGVMLTRVIDEDGAREYTLTVHHGKIDKLTDEGRLVLMAELEGIFFEEEGCSFNHRFLNGSSNVK